MCANRIGAGRTAMTSDDYELVEAALAATDGCEPAAMRVLRDECGWTVRRTYEALQRVRLMSKDPSSWKAVP